MEPTPANAARPEPPRNELRALVQLRGRIEAAAQEVERLRRENAALAARVAELEAEPGSGAPAFLTGGDPEKLKAQIQGFIDAIDRVLHTPEPADASKRRAD